MNKKNKPQKIGIIGCGSMGGMLAVGFLEKGVVEPGRLLISTRRPGAAGTPARLRAAHGDLVVTTDNSEVAAQCETLFICVKPGEVKGILEEIHPYLCPSAHLVSIAASVTLAHLGLGFGGKISRVVPSITFKTGNSVTLLCHNHRVTDDDAAHLSALFKGTGEVRTISEKDLDTATNLTSTAPGLIAAMFREFVEAGARNSDLSRREIEDMVIETFFGISTLFHRRQMKFPDTVSQVATRGGITEAGNRVIRDHLPPFFDELFNVTLAKFDEIKKDISHQFSIKN